jgi:hypothetical protein
MIDTKFIYKGRVILLETPPQFERGVLRLRIDGKIQKGEFALFHERNRERAISYAQERINLYPNPCHQPVCESANIPGESQP